MKNKLVNIGQRRRVFFTARAEESASVKSDISLFGMENGVYLVPAQTGIPGVGFRQTREDREGSEARPEARITFRSRED